MPKCSFCGNDLLRGTGLMYVKKDTTVYYFCKRKCEKNLLKLHRNPRKAEWTAVHKKWKGAGSKEGG